MLAFIGHHLSLPGTLQRGLAERFRRYQQPGASQPLHYDPVPATGDKGHKMHVEQQAIFSGGPYNGNSAAGIDIFAAYTKDGKKSVDTWETSDAMRDERHAPAHAS